MLTLQVLSKASGMGVLAQFSHLQLHSLGKSSIFSGLPRLEISEDNEFCPLPF